MAREVLTVAGTVVGAYFGYPQLGFMIGSMVGNAVDPVTIKGPSLGDAKVQTVQDGAPIPRVWGRAAIAGTVIDRGEPIRVERETQQGKGGGPVTIEERELMTFAILISELIQNITRIWENDKLVYDVRPESTILQDSAKFAANFTFYDGDETQLPDPTLEAIHGVGNTPAHRGTAYVVFPLYDYTEKGMAIPRYLFEVVSSAAEVSPATVGNWWVFRDTAGTAFWSTDDFVTFNTHSFSSSFAISGAAYNKASGLVCTYSSTVVRTFSGEPPSGSVVATSHTGMTSVGNWAVMRSFGSAVGYAGGVSPDGGLAWEAVVVPTGGYVAVNDIARAAAGSWVCLVAAIQGVDDTIHTGTGATPDSWTFRSQLSGSSNPKTLIRHSSGYVLTGSGVATRVMGLTGDYQTWTSLSFPNNTAEGFPGCDACDVAVAGLSIGSRVIVGGGFNDTSLSPIYTSDDGGTTYRCRALLTDFGGRDIVQGDDGLIVMAGQRTNQPGADSGAAYVAISSDNGGTWAKKALPFADIAVISTAIYVGRSHHSPTTVDPTAVALSVILTDLHGRVGIVAGEIDVSDHTATYVKGFVYGSTYNTADAIRELGKTFLFDAYSADAKLRYPARGAANSFTITEDDLLEDPDILERRAEIELPRKFHLGYQDYEKNYAVVKATSLRTSPDVRVIGEAGLQTSVVMSGTEAIQLSDKLHKVAWVDLEGEFTIKVPDNWSYLTPTDCGTVTFRSITKRVRIERIEAAEGVLTLTVRHDRISSYTSDLTPIIVRTPLPPSSTFAGETTWAFANLPVFNDADDFLGYHVAGAGVEAGWRGYQLERSLDDGVTYTYVQTYSSGAVMGSLLAALGDASAYVTDYQNELRLSLVGPSDTLESATRSQVLRSANAVAIIKDDSTCEIVQFQDMAEESANVWVGTTLLRGRKNTTPQTHAVGAQCVLLSTASFVQVDPSLIEAELWHRPTSIGNSSEDSEEIITTLDPVVSQTEWAPAYLRLTRSGDNLTATWSPRPRLGTSMYPVHSVNFLGYRVTLTKGANTVTFDQTSSTFTYDTSTLGSPTINVSVRGINRYTGVGDAVTDAL